MTVLKFASVNARGLQAGGKQLKLKAFLNRMRKLAKHEHVHAICIQELNLDPKDSRKHERIASDRGFLWKAAYGTLRGNVYYGGSAIIIADTTLTAQSTYSANGIVRVEVLGPTPYALIGVYAFQHNRIDQFKILHSIKQKEDIIGGPKQRHT